MPLSKVKFKSVYTLSYARKISRKIPFCSTFAVNIIAFLAVFLASVLKDIFDPFPHTLVHNSFTS